MSNSGWLNLDVVLNEGDNGPHGFVSSIARGSPVVTLDWIGAEKLRLDYQSTLVFLEDFLESATQESREALSFDPAQRVVRFRSHGQGQELVLPLVFPSLEVGVALQDYVASIPPLPPDYVIVLMRAGSASLGFYREGELDAHKVIRKYMVRMSQGRSQISYLNKKGKSRAGSRVRLRETVEFFEEINEKLRDWFDEFGKPEMIFHSCPVRLWSLWFSSRVEAPFTSDDPSLIHIPHHVHQPDHEELLRINRLLSSGTVEQIE